METLTPRPEVTCNWDANIRILPEGNLTSGVVEVLASDVVKMRETLERTEEERDYLWVALSVAAEYVRAAGQLAHLHDGVNPQRFPIDETIEMIDRALARTGATQ